MPVILLLLAAAGIAALAYFVVPSVTGTGQSGAVVKGENGDEHAGHAHDEHGHEHGEVAPSIKLSPAALKNIRYKPYSVELSDYERAVSMPGIIIERPGVSQVRVTAPMTGVVVKSNVHQGEAIQPGNPLFELRLTHEDVVSAQSEILATADSLDVVQAEIDRLESITEGVIAQKRILDQRYERQKLEARLRAQRQALLLHGLSDEQIDLILQARQLLPSVTVRAPAHESHDLHPYHVQSIDVQLGQQVTAGDTLCVLADHCELYIEGTAFDADTPYLRDAVEKSTPISADILVSARREAAVRGLKLLYLADQVDRESRALHFYVKLPNEIVSDRKEGSQRFLQWRYNPGQRVELSIPVESWTKRIVVPAEAVVNDGAESYVYRQSGDTFVQVPVHVEHRDKKSAVLASDGSVFPGEVIAASGAFQIHLAIKNQSGGAIDPHAGHHH
jgi:multidrug efflux pump subunit AcrA (membrane-fusion protein)